MLSSLSPQGGASTPPADTALRVLFGSTVAAMAAVFLSGALSTHATIQRHSFDGPTPTAWIPPLLQGLQIFFLATDGAMIYALICLARAAPRVAGLAYGALGCTAVGTLSGLAYLVAPESAYGLLGNTTTSGLMTLVDLAGSALILAVLLRLGGRTIDAPAAAFLALLILRQAVLWSLYSTDVGRHLREAPWAGFALRQSVTFLQSGLLLWLIHRARGDAARAAPSDVAQPPVLATDEHAQGLRMVIFGALWLLGGAGVSIASYAAAASSRSGGRYVLTYGAVVYGAVQIVRGVARLTRSG